MNSARNATEKFVNFLLTLLMLRSVKFYFQRGPLDLTFLSKFAHIKGCEDMCFEPIVPVNPPAEFCGYDDIFEAIREKDRLVHHPYESFDVVVDFVKNGGNRSECSCHQANLVPCQRKFHRLLRLLSKAAENGKQVTVLVELKARFDEENNIQWATKLEKGGLSCKFTVLRDLKPTAKSVL